MLARKKTKRCAKKRSIGSKRVLRDPVSVDSRRAKRRKSFPRPIADELFDLLLGSGGSIWGDGSVGEAKGQGRLDGGVFPSEWRSTIVKADHGSSHTYGTVSLPEVSAGMKRRR